MIKLNQFEAFNAVMLSGSMTAAAKTLHTSQPNISRSISKLEAETGLSLFERTPGKLVPTADGLALYKEVQRSFVGLQRLRDAANRIRRSGSGILRIGAVQSHSMFLLPAAIQEFTTEFPNATLSIHSAHSTVLAQWVRELSCDFAIVSQRNANDGVDGERLYSCDAVCIMPASHRLAAKKVITPSDLAGEKFISFPQGEPQRRKLDQTIFDSGVEMNEVIETSYSTISCALVAKGVGVAVVNPLIALQFLGKDVVARPFNPALKHDVIGIYPAGKQPDRFVSKFLTCLKNVLREQNEIVATID